MKKTRIVNAIGHLDDDLISEAAEDKTAKKRVWIKCCSAAACLVAALIAVAAVVPRMVGRGDPVPVPPVGDGVPPAINESILEKYFDYVINAGNFSSYIGGHVIPQNRIGSKIEAVTVTAGWKNGAAEWIDTEKLNAEVYAIEGVSQDVAAALRFIDQGEAITTTHYYVITNPNAEYNGKLFPDYKAENPVRYLEESDMGECNGWQDFGLGGEIRTITMPIGSTYIYQMYSYYIRNDLSHIYGDGALPDKLADLPGWLCDTATVGRRSFWYSMGGGLSQNITLLSTSEVESENEEVRFIMAEYKIRSEGASGAKEENWVVYFMEEDGVYSAFSVVVHENYDFVKSYSESIIRSYQKK